MNVRVVNRHFESDPPHVANVARVETERVLLNMGWASLWFSLDDGDAEADGSLYLDIEDRIAISTHLLVSRFRTVCGRGSGLVAYSRDVSDVGCPKCLVGAWFGQAGDVALSLAAEQRAAALGIKVNHKLFRRASG